MKLILDLDDDVVKNMQEYAVHHDISINNLVTKLFNDYVQDPAHVIDQLHDEKGSLEDLERFSKLLTIYFNEAILDITDMIGTEEEQDDDAVMAEVFRKMTRDHLQNPHLLTDLYNVYKEGN